MPFDATTLLPDLPAAADLRAEDDREHFGARPIAAAMVTATHWVTSNAAGELVLRARDGRGVELGLVFVGLRAEAFELGLEGEIAAAFERLERRPGACVVSDEPFARLRVEGFWRHNTLVDGSGRRNGRREMVVARWSRLAGAGTPAAAACGWMPHRA
jgi:hypothetical protein